MTSAAYNVSSYNNLVVDFYFYATSMENGEDFSLSYFNGSTWVVVANYVAGSSFNNNGFYHATVPISGVVFPTNAQFRFTCDASDNTDLVYIDQVVVTGSNTPGQSLGDQPSPTCELLSFTRTGLDADENRTYLLLYPNPVTNSLTVQTAEEVETLRIYGANGAVVKQFNNVKNGSSLDVSALKPGMYIAAFTTDEGIITRMFIKK